MMKINLVNYENLAEMIDFTLSEEITETDCAISNERLWEKGSDGEQSLQHEMNVEDLKEWKAILQYAMDYGVLAYDKEIHHIWAEMLFRDFAEELKGMIENDKCMWLDTDMEEDVLDSVNEILELEF